MSKKRDHGGNGDGKNKRPRNYGTGGSGNTLGPPNRGNAGEECAVACGEPMRDERREMRDECEVRSRGVQCRGECRGSGTKLNQDGGEESAKRGGKCTNQPQKEGGCHSRERRAVQRRREMSEASATSFKSRKTTELRLTNNMFGGGNSNSGHVPSRTREKYEKRGG